MKVNSDLKKQQAEIVRQERSKIKELIQSEKQKVAQDRFARAHKIQSLELELNDLIEKRKKQHSRDRETKTIKLKAVPKQEPSVNETNTDNSNNDSAVIKSRLHSQKKKIPASSRFLTPEVKIRNEPRTKPVIKHLSTDQFIGDKNERVKNYARKVKMDFKPRVSLNKALELSFLETKRNRAKPLVTERIKLPALIN